jgi:TolB protein
MGRAVVTGALALLAAVIAAAPAYASFPGRNGLVSFSTVTGSPPGNIIKMSAAGRHRRRLTSSGDSRNPAWSPGGGRIAFDRSRGGRRKLFVMNAGGSNLRRVATGRLQAENPAWSPDGRKLVFQGCRQRGNCDTTAIFVVPATGGPSRRIARNGSDPVWSPNGRWIVYHGKVARRDPCATLVRVRPSGRLRRAILSRRRDSHNVCSRVGRGADFSPNGRRLVFYGLHAAGFRQYLNPEGVRVREWTYDPAMYTVRANGRGKRRRLATRPSQRGGFFALPFIWSPDGRNILWRDDRGTFIANTRARRARRIPGRSGVGYGWQRRAR